MSVPFIGWEAEPKLNWLALASAFDEGHQRAKADRGAGIISKDQEGARIWDHAPVERHAIPYTTQTKGDRTGSEPCGSGK